MPLTWQEVAGRVAAPDFTGSGEMITRGLQGIAAALRKPEQDRKAQEDKDLQFALMGRGLIREDQIDKDRASDRVIATDARLTAAQEKETSKQASLIQAGFMSRATAAGRKNMSLDGLLNTDEIYKNAPPEVQAQLAASAIDAWNLGQTQAEDDSDDATRSAESLRNYNQNERQIGATAANAKATNRRLDAEETRRAAEYNTKLLETRGGLKPGIDKETELVILTELAKSSELSYQATGRAYVDKPLSKVAEDAGMSDLTADAKALFDDFNDDRQEKGLDRLPYEVLTQQVDSQSGKNGWVLYDTYNEGGAKPGLETRARQYDAAKAERARVLEMITRANNGEKFTNKGVQNQIRDAQVATREAKRTRDAAAEAARLRDLRPNGKHKSGGF